MKNNPICIGCNRPPSQIPEYIEMGQVEEMSPEEFVRQEEGTFNPENGHFACTECYIRMGMPSSKARWVAP